MKTKIEKIKEAYGPSYETAKVYMRNDGTSYSYKLTPEELGFTQESVDKWSIGDDIGYSWRPIALRGIDNNNGWASIQEFGIPKEAGIYEFYNSDIIKKHEITSFTINPQAFNFYTHWRPYDTRKPLHI